MQTLLDVPVVDLRAQAPRGKPCASCGCPCEEADKFCPACGTAQPPSTGPAPSGAVVSGAAATAASGPAAAAAVPADRRRLQCKSCGAQVRLDADQRSYVCPFCDSTLVVETEAEAGRTPPEFIIGFAITPEAAQTRFSQWLQQRSFFRPVDVAQTTIVEKLRGVYLPFWSFSMLAQSEWAASIGENWERIEHYTESDGKGGTVQRSRTVIETEWWDLSGDHHRYYSGYLVSASRGLKQEDAQRIQPFNLPALKRYEPYYLAGWACEDYSVDRDQALAACEAAFREDERQEISRFLPGDTFRNLRAQTQFCEVQSDLCLLPVYLLSFRYREKLCRFYLNGQTGQVYGERPLSGWRVLLFIVGIVLAVLTLLVVVNGLARYR